MGTGDCCFHGSAIATVHKGIYCTHVHTPQSSAGIAVPSLFSEICTLIDRGSYVVGEHASERLLERGIMESEGLKHAYTRPTSEADATDPDRSVDRGG